MPALQPRFLNLVQPPDRTPHAASSSYSRTSKLNQTGSILKTLIVPALISLVLVLLLSYVIVPTWRRYRNRYSQYLPLDAISSQTQSLRDRVQSGLLSLIVPSHWPRFRHGGVAAIDGHDSDAGFDDDDGEELFEVDENRRSALSLDSSRHDDGRRLSRELEEGFKDDSDDESDTRLQASISSRRV